MRKVEGAKRPSGGDLRFGQNKENKSKTSAIEAAKQKYATQKSCIQDPKTGRVHDNQTENQLSPKK